MRRSLCFGVFVDSDSRVGKWLLDRVEVVLFVKRVLAKDLIFTLSHRTDGDGGKSGAAKSNEPSLRHCFRVDVCVTVTLSCGSMSGDGLTVKSVVISRSIFIVERSFMYVAAVTRGEVVRIMHVSGLMESICMLLRAAAV